MNAALFKKLTGSLKQMKAIRAGTLKPARSTTLTPEHPRAVRSRLGLTQEQFAEMIGVPIGTLRNWEQGHREPTGPAKALLVFAAQYPREMAKALNAPTSWNVTVREGSGMHTIRGTDRGRIVSVQPTNSGGALKLRGANTPRRTLTPA